MNDSIHGGLRVCQSTPLVQLQDRGRFGCRHLGVTQGGALDWLSMGWANWLLGNPLDAAVIEIALGGFVAECRADGWLALAGGDLGATLDGQPLPAWGAFAVRGGSAWPSPPAPGAAHLPGGARRPPASASWATPWQRGWHGPRADGKALAAGDSLGWLADGARPRALPLPSERIMDCTGEARLELILGAQIGDFPAMSLFDAFNGDWQVDTRADRMGVRLLGPRLECRQQSMISEGIALGAVQVPPDGQPIVLLNDRQTIGGYPRLGALAPLALARLAQCLPGQRVRLLPTVQEAAHREHRRLLAAWDA
ncbi:biotin-dependent carboxyltransferase family protein [Pseudomonas aeruginosa]|uniref:5-oxoprolinase subunit C family protein n=1 Tax=Pseudomonas aeruginosa TaxID=287 RepID=UPI00193C752B|nr:biotin-dependent carboxyltransferase family protein [Pseudomonas aeruginosa]MBM2499802.1 biotin-dependent carboxyltransferase family protein [Pseudomonas aeruginosa]